VGIFTFLLRSSLPGSVSFECGDFVGAEGTVRWAGRDSERRMDGKARALNCVTASVSSSVFKLNYRFI